jgi:hypothetical protein
MAERRHCQVCGLEFGAKVEAGEFVQNKLLRKADVAQVCKGCLDSFPAEVVADLRARPKFFAANARRKKQGEINPKDAGVRFPDRRRVINTAGFTIEGV